ncbi:MAG: T9SS type A sorting domain-containing protein [Bacteroidia bacterium]|jgi:hypothetical protein|nr:T9SS type A sorting domain-containing protein [Bacteroidia bacterium]
MKTLVYYLLVVCSFFSFQSSAQIAEQLFRDTTEFTGGMGTAKLRFQDTYLVSGLIRNGKSGIVSIDSNGNSIWELQLNKENPISVLTLGNDGFVYASLYENSRINYWKINPVNGNIIWNKNYRAYSFLNSLDYDSSTFIQSYQISYDGINYQTRYVFIAKSTGDTLTSYFIGDLNWLSFGSAMAIDQNKDIYFTNVDSITKVSGSNPNIVIWKQQYASSQIQTINYLYYNDTNGSLYAVGTRNNSLNSGFIARVNASDGVLQKFQVVLMNRDIKPNKVKTIDHHLYVSWQHIYVGGSPSYTHISKYDMVLDTMVWNSIYETPGNGHEASIDFDVDDSGYVYTTGYAQSDNYGPGIWLNLKIESLTGTVLNSIVISKNQPPYKETWSNGFGIVSLPDRILVFGNLEQTAGLGRALYLTILNPNNFDILLQKSFGNYLFPSKTIEVKKHPNGNFIVFKQLGRGIALEMFDTLNVLKWEKSFTATILEGHQLAIAPLGDIYFSAIIRKTSIHSPFASDIADSICVFHLDKFGNLKGVVKRVSRFSKLAPLELIAEDSFAILLFHQNDTVYAIKTRNNSQLAIVNTQMRYQSTNETTWNASYDKNDSELFLFGRNFSAPRILKLRKHPFVVIDTLALPLFNDIENTTPIDTSNVLLLGRNFPLNSAYGVFNTNSMQMVWSVNLPSSFKAYQTVIDSAKTHLYVVGKTSTNDIRIQKHLLSNGNLIRSYTYVTGSTKDEIPLNIEYNEFRRQIIIVGTVRENNLTSNVFMMSIDSSLTFPTVHIRPNPIEGADRATCVEQVSRLRTIAGGSINMLGVQWGAVFEIPDTFFCKPKFVQTTTTACGPYLWNGITITNSGTYTSTLVSRDGCDSIVELSVTILPSKISTQFDTACYSVVWRGDTLTQSGIYYDTLVSANGCDSIMSLNLLIDSLNTGIIQVGDTLISNQPFGTYQWINCTTALLVSGANSRSFLPSVSGSYKAIISNGFCTDTSNCINFVLTNIRNNAIKPNYNISPNPFSQYTILTVPFAYKNGQIKIVNTLGELVRSVNVSNNAQVKIDRQQLPAGLYFFYATFDDQYVEGKLIIQD